MLHAFLLTAVEGCTMSKYIPGNQKQLTLDDRKYIEKSLNEGVSFKGIARFLCKVPTTISKKIRLHRLDDCFHKDPFYNAKTSAFIDIDVARLMPAERLSYAVSNVHLAIHATRHALISKRAMQQADQGTLCM